MGQSCLHDERNRPRIAKLHALLTRFSRRDAKRDSSDSMNRFVRYRSRVAIAAGGCAIRKRTHCPLLLANNEPGLSSRHSYLPAFPLLARKSAVAVRRDRCAIREERRIDSALNARKKSKREEESKDRAKKGRENGRMGEDRKENRSCVDRLPGYVSFDRSIIGVPSYSVVEASSLRDRASDWMHDDDWTRERKEEHETERVGERGGGENGNP